MHRVYDSTGGQLHRIRSSCTYPELCSTESEAMAPILKDARDQVDRIENSLWQPRNIEGEKNGDCGLAN